MIIGYFGSIAVALCMLGGASWGQVTPLDPSLFSNFGPLGGNFGGVRYFVQAPEADSKALPPRISASVNYSADAKEVRFLWKYRDDFPNANGGGGTGAAGSALDVESVAFRPTAVTHANGVGTRFFVAGYNERTSMVVVEQWDFALALGVTINPVTQKATAALSRNLTRSTILVTQGMSPLHSIAYNSCDDTLWLFESAFPHAVSSVDPAAGLASLQYRVDSTATGHEFLATARHVDSMSVMASAPGGSCFVFVFVQFPIWELGDYIDTLDDQAVTVMRDGNCDGAFDSVASGTYKTEVGDTGYYQHEDWYFQ